MKGRKKATGGKQPGWFIGFRYEICSVYHLLLCKIIHLSVVLSELVYFWQSCPCYGAVGQKPIDRSRPMPQVLLKNRPLIKTSIGWLLPKK